MPIMSIYRLPHGQYGYSGHVINLPQDVVSFATSLPRLPSELDVLVVRKEDEQSHRDFRVRRAVVEQALIWLLQNNRYYRANQVHLNQDALAQLPEDGDLSTLTSVPAGPPSTQQPPPSDEDPYGAHLAQSFVPNAIRPMTEQETVCQSVQDRQTGTTSTLMWPTIGGTPINEFTTEGYFSMAFPALFPTGAADFLGQRCNQVTIGYYFKHLLMYEDSRFAIHPRFRFFALNTKRRSFSTLTRSSPPSTLPFCLMEVTSTMLHLLRQTRTFATRPTLTSLISVRISLTLWQHVNVTLAALKLIAFAHVMAVSSVDLAIPSLSNPTLPL